MYRSLPRSSLQTDKLVSNRNMSSFNEQKNDGIENNLNEYDEQQNLLEAGMTNICDRNEVLVRNEMKALGISSELINSHIERGARSPIIGTYRILLHRYIYCRNAPSFFNNIIINLELNEMLYLDI